MVSKIWCVLLEYKKPHKKNTNAKNYAIQTQMKYRYSLRKLHYIIRQKDNPIQSYKFS